MRSIFTINEMITIVMEITNNLEFKNLYGYYECEEINLPKPINEKLQSLNSAEYETFMEKMEEIAKEILQIKTGELNELNCCHQEIIFLIKEHFKDL